MVRGYALLVRLDIIDGVGRLGLQRDPLAGGRLDEYLGAQLEIVAASKICKCREVLFNTTHFRSPREYDHPQIVCR